MAQSLLQNAIGWVHFKLMGGWTRFRWFVGIFGIMGIAALITPRVLVVTKGGPAPDDMLHVFVGVELILAIFVMLLVTANAIRRDRKEKMMESHRLMPTTAPEAIIGYLIGPNVITLGLYAVLVVLGSIGAAAASVAVSRFLIASAITLLFGIFATVAMACGSMGAGAALATILLPVVVPVMGGNPNLLQALPGLALFVSPLIRKTVFSMQAGTDEPAAYAISELFQVLAGILFFIGACRRYRAPEKAGFTPFMGVAMVVVWIAASAIGIAHWDLFRWHSFRNDAFDPTLQFAFAVCIAILLAIWPIHLSDILHYNWALRKRFSMNAKKPSAPTFLIVACCVCAITSLGPVALPEHATWKKTAAVAVIVLAVLLAVRYWQQLALPSPRAGFSGIAYLATTWGGPPLLVLTLTFFSLYRSSEATLVCNALSALSAPVALYDVWGDAKQQPTWQILAQVGLAAACAALAFIRRQTRAHRRLGDRLARAALTAKDPSPLGSPLPKPE